MDVAHEQITREIIVVERRRDAPVRVSNDVEEFCELVHIFTQTSRGEMEYVLTLSCLIDVETLNREADVFLRHRHLKPSFTDAPGHLATTHKHYTPYLNLQELNSDVLVADEDGDE